MWLRRSATPLRVIALVLLAAFVVVLLLQDSWAVRSGSASGVGASVASVPSVSPVRVRKRPLHVFRIQNIDQIALEFMSWLAYLENIGRPLVMHGANDALCSDAIVMGDDPTPTVEAVAAGKLRNVGFFQYGDERGFKGSTYKHYKAFPYFLRNYFIPSAFAAGGKVVYVPVGSHSHIRPVPEDALLPSSLRGTMCNFFGSISSSLAARNAARLALMESLKRQGNPCMAELQGNFGGNIRPFDFSIILRNSAFTLCPRGHSEETIRLYDAMACGSIPVVLKGFLFIEGQANWRDNHPFVVLNSWDELSVRLRALLDNKPELDRIQARVVSFYRDLRANTSRTIATHIDASFRAVYGDDL